MKMRNGANSAWISLWELDGTFIATDISLGAGTAGAPSLYFTGDTNTGIYSPGADQVAISTGGSGRLFVDASGRLLVGTSSSPSGGSGQYAKIVTQGYVGNDAAEGSIAIQRGNVASNITTGQAIGNITFNDSAGQAFGQIYCYADANAGTSDYPGRLVFSTTADGASSPTSRFVIKETGDVLIPAASSTKGLWIGTGDADGNGGSANFRIGQNSNGVGSSTLYIGNAAIQVSSDARLKENIQDTTLSAVEELQRVRIVDFTWNDPSDTSYNNRNARGTWTGVIAQELIEVFPFAVNAPRKEDDLSIDHDSDSTWTVEQQQLVPVLIKAIQEQQAVIADLQSRLTALEAA